MNDDSILLQPYQAAEIFFRICLKNDDENTDYTALDSGERLSALMLHYKKKEPCLDLSRKILGEIKPPRKLSKQAMRKKNAASISSRPVATIKTTPSDFYNLGLDVRNQCPHRISKTTLTEFLKFIDNSYTLNPEIAIKKWTASSELKTLEGDYYLYHYAVVDKIQGVLQCVLNLKRFHHAKLEALNLEDGMSIHSYNGEWSTFADDYLRLEMKLNGDAKNDLRMVAYRGNLTEIPELILGQYHNVLEDIFSGNMILIPTKDTSLNTRFIPLADRYSNENNYIKSEVWDFCFRKHNVLKVPRKVIKTNIFKKVFK